MINITITEYDKFRVACPCCNNQIYALKMQQEYDRYCKKCAYRAWFYYSNNKTHYVHFEDVYGSTEKGTLRRLSVRVNYPTQSAVFITLASRIGQHPETYTMPLKDEYFDDNCFIRMDAIDAIMARYRRMSIMR